MIDSTYTIFKIISIDKQGELIASPTSGEYRDRKFILKNNNISSTLCVEDEFFGKFKKGGLVKAISKIGENKNIDVSNVFGVAEMVNNVCFVNPIERGHKPYILRVAKGIKNNDFLELEIKGNKEAHLVKNYGPCTMEMINEVLITQKYQLPHTFDANILQECQKLPNFEDDNRSNLTKLPFVTIDGDDSRDFDDAVYAKKTEEGFELIVAIADVAFYVRPNSQLDKEAYKRGNSVYLPQIVIPMLPESLSNDLCSLNPMANRPVIACSMNIDNNGNLLSYHFERATIKSIARLTYKEVEDAIGGKFNETTKKVFTKAIQPIYEAYFALEKARKQRGTLEIESSEIKIKFDKKGNISAIEKFQSLTSHKIIEEFMIAANVATAKFLGKFKNPIIYRIHDKPLEEKLKEIKPLLADLKLKLPDYGAIKPQHLNKILEICHRKKSSLGIDDLILRLQCQAKYSPHNIGHFGLNLEEYVHFTSPIRRYSDLLIHREIINVIKAEKQVYQSPKLNVMEEIGDHLCITERKAVAAERDITARYLSLYLKPMIGTDFEVRISGFSNAGIFVRVESIGAEGLIPMRSLPKDYYQIFDANSKLKGSSTKLKFYLGDLISATLYEAAPISGGLIFSYTPPLQGKKTINNKTKNKDSKNKKKDKRKEIKKSNEKGKKCKKSSQS